MKLGVLCIYKLRSSWTSELLSLVFFNIIRRCISAAVAQFSPSHYTKLTNQHSWEGKPNIYTQHTLSTFVLLLLTCHSTGPGKDERFQSFCKGRLICTTTGLSNRNAWDYSSFGLLYGRADSPVVELATLPLFLHYIILFICFHSILLRSWHLLHDLKARWSCFLILALNQLLYHHLSPSKQELSRHHHRVLYHLCNRSRSLESTWQSSSQSKWSSHCCSWSQKHPISPWAAIRAPRHRNLVYRAACDPPNTLQSNLVIPDTKNLYGRDRKKSVIKRIPVY